MDTSASVKLRGTSVRQLRKLRGLDIGDLAALVSVSPQRISQIETGVKPGVRPSLFGRICAALNVADADRLGLIDPGT